MKQAETEAEEAERRRLYYVAMTRAIDRLIVSGSLDPSRPADSKSPIGWVLDRLGGVELDGDAPAELERGGARLLLRVDRYRPPQAQPEPEPEEAPQLSLFSAEEVPVLPPIQPFNRLTNRTLKSELCVGLD